VAAGSTGPASPVNGEAREAQVALHGFGPRVEPGGLAGGEGGRARQLLVGPRDLDAEPDHGAHPRAGGQVQPDDTAERVPDDHRARRVDQVTDGVGHGGEGVGGQRGGAAVAGEVGRHPVAREQRGEPVPHLGRGAQPVQKQDYRPALPAPQHPQIAHRTPCAHGFARRQHAGPVRR
jgi:hypothetical protein